MALWSDPATLQRETIIFGHVVHFVSGLYAWETVVNFFFFDWPVISGKRRFLWPMSLYFACRYLMLFALVGILVSLNTTREINCQALYTFNQFTGNAAIGLASTLLMHRTIAVWNRNLWVIIPLMTVSLGQWGILLHGIITVVSSWSPHLHACVVEQSDTIFLGLIYFYTMCFDFVVMAMSLLGLYHSPGRSSLWKLLFTDGIIYFALAFASNIVPAVFIGLNLNPVMNIMFSVPAACVAAVFACRSFIRVATYSNPSQYAHSSGPSDPRASTGIGFQKSLRFAHYPKDTFDSRMSSLPYRFTVSGAAVGTGTNLSDTSGVHVLMETFSQTVEDDKPQGNTLEQPQVWSEDKDVCNFSSGN